MGTQGYGYRAWGGSAQPMTPLDVGQQLAGGQASGMPSLGLPAQERLGVDPDMDGDGAMMPPPQPSLRHDGDSVYDPAQEHSASSTKAALEDAIRRMQDPKRPALSRPAAPNNRWQLASLGLPPMEIDLLTASGDTTGVDGEP